MLGLLEWMWLGVFIALNHQFNHWEWLLSMGTPDTVRCASHVTQPLGFDRWSFVFLWHRTVRCRTGHVLFNVRCGSDGCAALPRTVCALFI
jgi:hypothetical protein